MEISSTRSREKQIAEQIYGNPALRENLTDEQAETLFNWAFDQLRRALSTWEDTPDETARPMIDGLANTLKTLLQSFNTLVYQLDHEHRDEESHAVCASFLMSADMFTELDEQMVTLLQSAVSHPADWSNESAFDFLFHFLGEQP